LDDQWKALPAKNVDAQPVDTKDHDYYAVPWWDFRNDSLANLTKPGATPCDLYVGGVIYPGQYPNDSKFCAGNFSLLDLDWILVILDLQT
jgi:hypothetical protein